MHLHCDIYEPFFSNNSFLYQSRYYNSYTRYGRCVSHLSCADGCFVYFHASSHNVRIPAGIEIVRVETLAYYRKKPRYSVRYKPCTLAPLGINWPFMCFDLSRRPLKEVAPSWLFSQPTITVRSGTMLEDFQTATPDRFMYTIMQIMNPVVMTTSAKGNMIQSHLTRMYCS